MRRRHGGDDHRCGVVAGRRDRQNDDHSTDRQNQGGDQRRPRRAVGVGHYLTLCSNSAQ